MSEIIWKGFKLGELFEFSSGSTFALKDYTLYKEYQEGMVEVVTSSKDNTSNSYMTKNDIPSDCPIYSKSLTINRNGSIGYCHYHDKDFIIPTGDSYTLLHKNSKFQISLNETENHFLSILITYIFTSEVFGYSYKVNSDRFDREIILLPCIEVEKAEESIWQEDGKFFTLATEYIKTLMESAKELREQKTIRLYEAERAKYEAERAKYEAEYLKEKENVVWKRFTLGDLFNFDSGNQLSANKKILDVSSVKNETYSIALITQSEKNNGVSGYLELTDEVKNKKMKNYLTYSMHFGLCFYHNYDFVLMDTHGSVFRLIPKYENLNKIMENNAGINYFFSKIITKICTNDIYSYNWLPNSTRASREIILLPCIEVEKAEESIWQEDGKFFTLATNFISYLYLSGRVNYNQKLIENYTYHY